jgi:hypothetical protein
LLFKVDHPHGIGNAWRWLASCLNMKPANGVVTTLMVNIVEVCGHQLFAKYVSILFQRGQVRCF